MPSIPNYQQQTNVGAFQGPNATPDDSGADVGAAERNVGAAGTGLASTGAYIKKAQDERDAMSYAGMAASQATLDNIQSLQTQKESAGPGAVGFTPKVLAGFDTYASQLLDNAPTPMAKQYLQQHIRSLRTSIGEQALGFEAQARIGLRIDNAQTATENAAKVVQQLPDQYGDQLANLRATMPDVGPEGKIKLDNAAVQSLTNAAASHWLDANPYTVRDATAKALGENGATGKTGVPWVDDATPVQVKTWNNAAIVKINQIEAIIRTTTNRQDAHSIGSAAFQTVVGTGIGGAVPPKDLGVPGLPAYKQADIDRVTSFVKNPSPYDPAIQAAAQKYGVDPNEIKMRIGIESGGNAKAVNPETGATGVGQFMPATAQRYGITDRTDPTQSINGIAQMLAESGGGGEKFDRTYFGGNANAKGPKTDQYAENSRAVRQNLIGSGTMPPLTTAQLEASEEAVLGRAADMAEAKKPGDAVFRDQAIAEAKSNWAKALQAQKGKDYNNFTTVLGATIKTGATSISDLPADVQQNASLLTPQNFLGIQAQFDRNIRQANGEYTKSNPAVVNALRNRIYLPDGDSQKISYPGDLTPFLTSINHSDFEHLRTEMAQANTPEGNPFLKQVNNVKETGKKMLVGSLAAMNPVAMKYPDFADDAAYRFGFDVDAKVKAFRAAGKDPQSLFTPGSKDYVLDPGRVAAFMPTEADIVAQIARAKAMPPSAAGQATVSPRLPGESPAAYLSRIGK